MSEDWEREVDAEVRGLLVGVPPMSTSAFAEQEARLRAAMRAPQQTTGTLRPPVERPPAQRQARRWFAAAAAVIVVACGAVALRGDVTGVQPGADGPLGFATGDYLYVREHGWYTWIGSDDKPADLNKFQVLQERVEERWVPLREGEDWLLRRHYTGEREFQRGTAEEAANLGLEFPGDPPPGEWRALCLYPGTEEQGGECGAGSWQRPTLSWIDDLPRDPAAMMDRLRRDAADHPTFPQNAFHLAQSALRSGLLPAEVQSSLRDALAMLPNIVRVEDVRLDGRTGTALALGFGDGRGTTGAEVVFDEKSGIYIGSRTVSTGTDGDIPAGTVINWSVVTTDTVDHIR